MIVRITLASDIGSDLGPFNLTANAGSVVPSTATRTQLINGLDVTVSNSATTLTATSTGDCTNGVTMNISGIPVEEGVTIPWRHEVLNGDLTGTSTLTITYTPAGATTPITLTDTTLAGQSVTNTGTITAKDGTSISVLIQGFAGYVSSIFLQISPRTAITFNDGTNSAGDTIPEVFLLNNYSIDAFIQLAESSGGGGEGGGGTE